MKRYKCIKAWAKNREGDIVDHYMMRRYPREVQQENFVEIVPKVEKPQPVAIEPEPVAVTPSATPEKRPRTPAKNSDEKVAE